MTEMQTPGPEVDFSAFLTLAPAVAAAKREKPVSDVLVPVAEHVNRAMKQQGMEMVDVDVLAPQVGDTFVKYMQAEIRTLADFLHDYADNLTTEDVTCIATHDGTYGRLKTTGLAPDREEAGIFAQANVSVKMDPRSPLGDALRKCAPREAKPTKRK